MKKVLMTAAVLMTLLSTGAMAQRYRFPSPHPNNYPQQSRSGRSEGRTPADADPGYDRPDYDQPGYGRGGNQPNYNYDYDDYQFDRHLDWWDRELNLSRRQERDIRRIHGRFEQQTQTINPRDPYQRDALRQLRQREFFDMMAVLDSRQRDRVIEHMRPYERLAQRGTGRGRWHDHGQGYGNGRGNGGYGPNRY